MKLYMHPVSTAARPVRLLIAENGITCDEELVDITTGAHHQPPYASLNPSRLVPMLDDDGFRLTESSAILKYLADKYDLPSYPKDLKKRARVNEVMDWLNTQLYRDLGYGVVYPQLFPHHKRRSDEAHAGAIDWGQQGARKWLQVLNDHWIGPNNAYLCGNDVTIADYFGSGIVSIGELIGCDFAAFPNVQRWLGSMRKLKSWDQVNAMFNGFAGMNKGKEFARV
ncbi:MAG TPA: glutathione S-transferase family protein [Rudaea sp.]